VTNATIQLASYYYSQERYDVAAKVFLSFQEKHPSHDTAPRALRLAAECHYKLEQYHDAIRAFDRLIETYKDQRDLRAEAMYWLGQCYEETGEGVLAYRAYKQLTWDYPESRWAKIARSVLTEDRFSRMDE
jgi:TolA-binding protein